MFVLITLSMLVFASGIGDAPDQAATTGPGTTTAPGPTQRPTSQRPTQQPSKAATQQATKAPTQQPTKTPQPTTTPTSKQPQYQNDDYQAGPPPANPPRVPYPASDAQAKTWLVRNSLYGQVTITPIRCSLTAINPQTVSQAELRRHLGELTACLMKEWDDVLASAGYIAVRPNVTIYTDTAQTPCGVIESYNAYYCSGDQRVYYAPNIIELLPPRAAASRWSVLLVMAHEFGHAIQARTGIMPARFSLGQKLSKSQDLAYSRRMELQADCLAGAFVGAIATSVGLSEADRKLLAASSNAFGDDVLQNNPNYVAGHGKGATRVRWVFTGLDNRGKLAACNTWVVGDEKVR